MQTDNRFLDDLARVANGAMGAAAGVRAEFEEILKQKLERFLAEADMVPRDEFEAIKAVAVKARAEQEVLVARVDQLEAEIARLAQPAAKRSAKPASKRRAKPKPAGDSSS
jgi:hypothetical protein